MRRTFSVGRLFGIELDVHPSWFLVYALVTYALARMSPVAAAGTAVAYVLAAAAALALFASVVVHELAHALVARRFGVRTVSIVLFLFGGVATIEAEPPTPLADALVAAAGPAMSVVVAALAYAALHATAVFASAWADAAGTLFAYLTVANVVLAAFNSLPAYPLDGGRILRALLWRLRGDRDSGTATAALVGIAFGGSLVVAALVAALATRTWEIGWYVVVAAFLVRQSFTQYRRLRRGRNRVLLVTAA